MRVFEGANAHELYRTQLDALLEAPLVPVRGMVTREIYNAVTIINQPWNHAHAVPGRRWNPWIAMSEAMWILGGRCDLEGLRPYNKRIEQYSDDGHSLYGAYGSRIRMQVAPLLERLAADPGDRRAILSIWRPDDLTADTKDPPCNDMVMFKLRDDRLHMTVINRSNDIHWGLYAVNIPTFGILLDYLAAALEVDMGTQTHLSNSLHVYQPDNGMEQNWEITKRMMKAHVEPLPFLPAPANAFTQAIPYDKLRVACNVALHEDSRYEGEIPFLRFADDFLRSYRVGGDVEDCRHADWWPDWVMAAKVFNDR